MTTRHTVKQGEHLSSIAARYGFSDYQAIWSYPENAELRKQRKDPHVLAPGDVVVVPEPRRKTVTKPTGTAHKFKLTAPIIRLEMRLLDPWQKPIDNRYCDFRVELGPSAVGGDENRLTDDNGRVGVNISRTAFDAEFHVFGKEKPLPSPIPRPPMSHKFDLFVGGLDPVCTPAGMRARLNNLGYFAGLTDGREDREQLRWAIEEFQRDHFPPSFKPNGDLDDDNNRAKISQTRRKLVEVHGDKEPVTC